MLPNNERIVVHLKTQRNQPYGSVRRCCERCGIMIWGNVPIEDGGLYTDDEHTYDDLPERYIRCDARGNSK